MGELGEIVPPQNVIATLKEIILNNNEYKKDLNFVQEFLSTVVIERQEKLKFEQEKELNLKKESLDLIKKKKLN